MGSGSSRSLANQQSIEDEASGETPNNNKQNTVDSKRTLDNAVVENSSLKSSSLKMTETNTLNVDNESLELKKTSSGKIPPKRINSGLSLTVGNNIGVEETLLVKMGTSMVRTKNCSEEFQSLDLGEPVVRGMFDDDKTKQLHPLALERFCLIEATSVSGFSSTVTTSSNSDHQLIRGSDSAPPNGEILNQLGDGLPLFLVQAATAADLRKASNGLRERGFDRATILACAPDPVLFARPQEDKKQSSAVFDIYQQMKRRNVFFCLPALIRAAPPSRQLYQPGRFTLSHMERDIKMSIIHLVAQDVTSTSGSFPAYFGSPSATQDSVSIGWQLGKIAAAHPDDINTADGMIANEFEQMDHTDIYRIKTPSQSHERSHELCIDESEIDAISKAHLVPLIFTLNFTLNFNFNQGFVF